MPPGFTDRDVADQTGKTFLVTGANTGIGFETARVLARQGASRVAGMPLRAARRGRHCEDHCRVA